MDSKDVELEEIPIKLKIDAAVGQSEEGKFFGKVDIRVEPNELTFGPYDTKEEAIDAADEMSQLIGGQMAMGANGGFNSAPSGVNH